MKKTIVILALLAVVSSGLVAGDKEFQQGGQYLTVQVGLNSYAVPFGASFEYGITENIGIGGTVMAQFWSDSWGWGEYSYTVITPSFDAAYHFTELKAPKLDLFAGASIGYSIASGKWKSGGYGYSMTANSDIFLSPFLAARYYVGRKTAVAGKVYFSATGDYDGIGGTVGVTFYLNK